MSRFIIYRYWMKNKECSPYVLCFDSRKASQLKHELEKSLASAGHVMSFFRMIQV